MTSPEPGAGPLAIQSVRIERRGGFAGMRASAERDYADLSAAQRGALDKLVSAAAAKGGPPAAAGTPAIGPAPGADRFSFRVGIVHANGEHTTIDLHEDTMPASLAALAKPSLA